jgi:hypothetical protein
MRREQSSPHDSEPGRLTLTPEVTFMRRAIFLLALAAALTYLYLVVFAYMVAFVAAQPTPTWWSGLFPTHRSGTLTWLVLFHAAGILLISLPFAIAIDRAFRRQGIWVASALTIVVAGLVEVPAVVDGFKGTTFFVKGFWIFDAMELIGVLPAQVYLVRRYISNNRLERTRHE